MTLKNNSYSLSLTFMDIAVPLEYEKEVLKQ